MSPYLFVMITEGLSSLLQHAVQCQKLFGLRIAKECPAISHLFFADDTLIFYRATKEEAQQVMQILKIYENASGQMINADKSSVLFEKNMQKDKKEEVIEVLEGMKQIQQSRYLGLPVVIGRTKKQVFSYIKERVVHRLKGWKEKLLSQAGKEVMLKSVILAMPTYAKGCIRLSKGVCVDICKEMAKFWWGGNDKDRQIHWLGSERLTDVKGNGGLGFRDLMEFNTAMLARQLWRILTRPNLMMSRILKGRYFKGEAIWKMNIHESDSWMWKSVLSACELLEREAKKRVGDGCTIDVWADRWLPDRGKGVVTTVKPPGCSIRKANELIQNGEWRMELMRSIFNEEDCTNIKKSLLVSAIARIWEVYY